MGWGEVVVSAIGGGLVSTLLGGHFTRRHERRTARDDQRRAVYAEYLSAGYEYAHALNEFAQADDRLRIAFDEELRSLRNQRSIACDRAIARFHVARSLVRLQGPQTANIEATRMEDDFAATDFADDREHYVALVQRLDNMTYAFQQILGTGEIEARRIRAFRRRQRG